MVASGAPGPPVVSSLLLVGMDRRPKNAEKGSIAPPSRPANGPLSVGSHQLATKTSGLICRSWSGKAHSVRQCSVRIGGLNCRTAYVARLLTSMGSIHLGGLHSASACPSSLRAEMRSGTLCPPQFRHPRKLAVPVPISVENPSVLNTAGQYALQRIAYHCEETSVYTEGSANVPPDLASQKREHALLMCHLSRGLTS